MPNSGEPDASLLHAARRLRPVIRLLESCGAATCLASQAGPTLTYANTGATAEDVVLAIGSAGLFSDGLFDLLVSISPPPYTETTLPTNCDDMNGRGPHLDD